LLVADHAVILILAGRSTSSLWIAIGTSTGAAVSLAFFIRWRRSSLEVAKL